MSEIKFNKEITKLIKNIGKVPDEFFVRTDGDKFEVIWFMDRQKPSVEQSYDFDMERFGITKDGLVIWGFDSGCSCPSPWSQEDYGDENYHAKTWKEFNIKPEDSFDKGWEEECYSNLQDYLLLIQKKINPLDVLRVNNAEIRRFLMKRVGYEKIKDESSVTVIHVDGDSELLKINDDKYVKVKDSSTDREYLLYVHNNIKTCREGIAWTFGLDEKEYNPIIET